MCEMVNRAKKAGVSQGKKLVVKAGGGQKRGREKEAAVVSPKSKSKIREQLKRAKDATKVTYENVVTKMNHMEESNAKRSEASLLDKTLETSDNVKGQFYDFKKKHDKVHEELLQKAHYLNSNIDTVMQKLTRPSNLESKDFAREYESRLH